MHKYCAFRTIFICVNARINLHCALFVKIMHEKRMVKCGTQKRNPVVMYDCKDLVHFMNWDSAQI